MLSVDLFQSHILPFVGIYFNFLKEVGRFSFSAQLHRDAPNSVISSLWQKKKKKEKKSVHRPGDCPRLQTPLPNSTSAVAAPLCASCNPLHASNQSVSF